MHAPVLPPPPLRLALIGLAVPLLACPLHDFPATEAAAKRAEQEKAAAAIALQEDRIDDAETHLALCFEYAPNDGDCWTNFGLCALRRGNRAAAKERFIKALRCNPEQAQAYNDLGSIYLDDGEHGRAEEMFRRALKVNPDYLEARHNLALTLYRAHRLDDAKREFRKAIAVSPNVAEEHEWLGIIALDEGELPAAVEHLQTSLQLAPQRASAWRNLATAYERLGRAAEAGDAWKACLAVDPQGPTCERTAAVH